MSGMTWKARLSGMTFQRKLVIILNTVLLIACILSAMALHSIDSSFETITAAERFCGDGRLRFSQIACYLPVGEGKNEEDILSLRNALQEKFVEQSLEAPEGGSLTIDAYSTRTKVTAVTQHASAEVSAFAVGGDFFHFHPLRLRSGSYIAERDLMDDLVILDEALAWRLFGGTELAGLTVKINGKPFVVAGVVAMDENFAVNHALTNEGTLFLSYSALKQLDSSISIDCYEIVLPDPISGYARSTLESLLPIGEGTMVEMSSRFSPLRLWDVVASFGERSMHTGAVVYPYWENALRYAEDHAALYLVLTVFTALFPLATLIALVGRGITAFRRFAARELPVRIAAAVEQQKENRLARLAAKDSKGE